MLNAVFYTNIWVINNLCRFGCFLFLVGYVLRLYIIQCDQNSCIISYRQFFSFYRVFQHPFLLYIFYFCVINVMHIRLTILSNLMISYASLLYHYQHGFANLFHLIIMEVYYCWNHFLIDDINHIRMIYYELKILSFYSDVKYNFCFCFDIGLRQIWGSKSSYQRWRSR